ncbi:polysaccharide deacetylase family protein [Bacillus marinisedimentorum]|uniref:polysaccharide deacetylase family protein n=1 Tax=Bacillus marinisedimentorum TaxID=1821260 RepID=UPI0007E195D3|nr:polysaccharide deacetylase family protein [Bacillus marinisedimentorum]
MNRKMIHIIVFVLILAVSYSSFQNPYTAGYIDSLKESAEMVSGQKDPLYQEIKEKAPEFNEKPIDARVDRVWKAIPGYNGKKVDIAKSFKKMKKDGVFDEQKLVFKEIPPEITLKDLPPAPVYKGNEEKKMVSFLINVAWGNEYIPDMLKTLKEYNIEATFFLEGRWVKKYPELAKMIGEAGHEAGNHSHTHADFKVISAAGARAEMEQANEAIKAATGQTPVWFAPPGGSYRDEIVKIAAEQDMGTVLWSVDTVDWKKPAPQVILQRINSKVHPGAMILMHPTASTALALEPMIKKLKAQGYSISTVSALLNEKRHEAR